MNHMDIEVYIAVSDGNNEDVKEIQGTFSIEDQLTPTNCTVLHVASEYGNITSVQEILSSHESLLLKLNSRGETALHIAARLGHYDVAKALINAAKSSRLQLNNFQTTSSTILESLIRTANVEFQTALHEAIRYNQVSVVELLVTEDPNHPHPQNKDDETPLYMASVRGYKEIITIILDNCILPTYGGPHGRTALHAAVLDLQGIGCVKLLLEKKRELITVTDDYGWTAFHYAAYSGNDIIIDDLVDADISMAYLPDKKYKRTPLHVAASEGSLGVMDKLFQFCPDCYDLVDGNGQNILHIAAERNDKITIEYVLINRKDSINLLIQKDKEGNTPLHQLAKMGCYVPEVMNHSQVDWEAVNGKSLTPLDVIGSRNINYVADQAKIRRKLVRGNAISHWGLHSSITEYKKDTFLSPIDTEHMEQFSKMRDTHMVVAALITTAALTAGFAMPGGFDGNAGPNQGSPALIKNTAFKTFVVTDTIALLCSLSSLFLYFSTMLYKDVIRVGNVVAVSSLLNLISIIAIMLAFITGTYAVLAHSLALAITVSAISSLLFLLMFYLIRSNFDHYFSKE